jgi:hypothetical protein
LENRKTVRQTLPSPLELIAARPEFFMRRGAVVSTWRRKKECRNGPYYQLCFREDGRQRWVYLGRDGPLVEAVRQALAQLQQPLERHRQYLRTRKRLMAAMRQHKVRLDANLRRIGLRLQGFEVRGWRKASGKLRSASRRRKSR